MKRLTLLTILLVVVGLTAGALEVKPSFTLSGSATLTWGIDLDNMHTGFTNAGTATLTVNLMAADGTDTHAGKGAMYGSITISNVELYWVGTDAAANEAGGAPAVAAQFFVPPFEFGVNGAPALSSNAAAAFEIAALTGNTIIDTIMHADAAYSFAYTGAGTYAKYTGKGFTVEADVLSEASWLLNVNDAYAFGVKGTATFAPVTLGLGVFQGINYTANPLNGYVSAGATLPIGAVNAAFDMSLDGATFQWEVSGNMDFHFNKDGTAYALAKFAYDPQGVNGLDSGLIVMVPVNTLAGPVNADLTFYYLDLTLPTQDIAVILNAGYTMKLQGDMTLAAALNVAFANEGASSTNMLTVNPKVVLGLTAAPATTLTVGWASGDLLLATPGMGSITAALAVTY